MEKSFIPYGKQSISHEDIDAVVKVLKSPLITQGPVVPLFEKELSMAVCSKYAVAFNSATSALHSACLALGISDKDLVWTSPNTFVASANCALYCGAQVDFVDINLSTGLIDIDLLEEKLRVAKLNNALPKLVIPVHFTGASCDMERINKLARIYNFYIVEDASHALGGEYSDTKVGSCKYSDITIFSFHPVKIITSGEGGMATTNNPHLLKRMRLYRSHGITKESQDFICDHVGPWSYEQQVLGYNYRMTDIAAALGMSQLKRLSYIVQERNRMYNYYKEKLVNLDAAILSIPEYSKSSVHLVVLVIDH